MKVAGADACIGPDELQTCLTATGMCDYPRAGNSQALASRALVTVCHRRASLLHSRSPLT